MFAFPLGLEVKTRRFPLMTAALFAVTVLYSILHMKESHQQNVQRLNSPATQEMYRARAALAAAACRETKLSDRDCRFLREHLASAKARNPITLVEDLDRAARRAYGAEAKRKVAELAEFVLDDKYWSGRGESLRVYPEFAAYENAQAEYRAEMIERHARFHALSPATFGLGSLLAAQFSHAGWLHLIGNMVFFLLLAIPVEERLGRGPFLGAYLIGGIAGLSLQLLFFKDPTQAVVGASANVSAVAGLFLVLFWRLKMRIWVSYVFIFNRTALISTKLFIPLFIVSDDLIGTLSGRTGVAHLAHLGGMGAGALGGWLWLKHRPLPEGHVFAFETDLILQADATPDPARKSQLLHEVLSHHAGNRDAQASLLATTLGHASAGWSELPRYARNAMKLHLSSIFASAQDESPAAAVALVGSLPQDWPLDKLIRGADRVRLSSCIKEAEETGQFATAIRLLTILHGITESAEIKNKIQQHIRALSERGSDVQSA